MPEPQAIPCSLEDLLLTIGQKEVEIIMLRQKLQQQQQLLDKSAVMIQEMEFQLSNSTGSASATIPADPEPTPETEPAVDPAPEPAPLPEPDGAPDEETAGAALAEPVAA